MLWIFLVERDLLFRFPCLLSRIFTFSYSIYFFRFRFLFLHMACLFHNLHFHLRFSFFQLHLRYSVVLHFELFLFTQHQIFFCLKILVFGASWVSFIHYEILHSLFWDFTVLKFYGSHSSYFTFFINEICNLFVISLFPFRDFFLKFSALRFQNKF